MRARLFNTWQKRLTSFVVASLISLAWLPGVIIASHGAEKHDMTYGTDCYMEPGIFNGGGKQICQSQLWDISHVLFYMQLSIGLVCTGLTVGIALAWIAGLVGRRSTTPVPPPQQPLPAIPVYAPRPPEKTHG